MTRNTCSKWNDVTSLLIKIDFGVRQGSALSPFLFAVYVDDMITRFYVSRRCFIALRADDILIFSPSLQELQNIVNTCELELLSIDMAINTKKSCTMCIEPRRDIKCGNITINNQNLPRVDSFLVVNFSAKFQREHRERAVFASAL